MSAAAAADATWVESNPALFIAFDPPGDAAGVSDAALASGVAAAMKAGVPTVVAAIAMAPGGPCDAALGPAGIDEARRDAEARTAARAGIQG